MTPYQCALAFLAGLFIGDAVSVWLGFIGLNELLLVVITQTIVTMTLPCLLTSRFIMEPKNK